MVVHRIIAKLVDFKSLGHSAGSRNALYPVLCMQSESEVEKIEKSAPVEVVRQTKKKLRYWFITDESISRMKGKVPKIF